MFLKRSEKCADKYLKKLEKVEKKRTTEYSSREIYTAQKCQMCSRKIL